MGHVQHGTHATSRSTFEFSFVKQIRIFYIYQLLLLKKIHSVTDRQSVSFTYIGETGTENRNTHFGKSCPYLLFPYIAFLLIHS
jgi:hypothetical protein